MAKKKINTSDEDSIVSVETNGQGDSDTALCKVINIYNGKLHLYFDGYGIQIDIPNSKIYRVGDTIKVNYSGKIGKSNFKKWIVD